MADNRDDATVLDELLSGQRLALAQGGELQELAQLARQLRDAAPDALMDPGLRRTLGAELGGRNRRRAAARPAPEKDSLRYTRFDTPVGTLFVAYHGAAVRYTDLTQNEAQFCRECLSRFGALPTRDDVPPVRLRRRVQEFLEERGRFQGQMDLSGLPEFQQRVLRKALEIRKGEVRTYHWIAREIGAPRAARAVGTALARNPIPILIPCHRVVRADYRIGEYGCGGPAKKREILQFEGVDLARLDRLASRGIRFQGSKTTHVFCLPGCYTGRRTKEQYRAYFPSGEAARSAGFRPCKVCRPA
ncbi:MAG: methylated-DNA--[protein]-cysteine S-methyltransferase [Chloroflexi bacterium]|nr:methylated-DNA--[protein]-cysteine S-methyltransferase [Chloroflexota bacterium]